MVEILIVEDDPNKLSKLIEEIVKVDGITDENIHDCADVKSAKRMLKEKKYNLLLLDINLPKTKSTKDVTKLSGLDVLKFIKINSKAIAPDHIVGITADKGILNTAEEKFSSLIWKVIEFKFTDDSWIFPLQSSIEYLIANDVPPYKNDGKTYHVEVGVVCALKEELNALLKLDIDWNVINVKYDHTKYYKGVIKVNDDNITIIAAAAPKMGMNSSAIIAHKLISSFHPQLLTMTGICAGIRDKTNIGDILIADPCFEWGGGKWCSDGDNGLFFKTAPYPWRVDESITALLEDISDDQDLFNDIYRRYDGKRPDNKPKVKIDAMASGSSVLQSSEMVGNIVDQHKNLIGLEMESYAVYTAAAICEEPRPICVTMKSVCDFGDEQKADGYHHYACHTSANLFFEFIKRWFD